MPLQAIRVRPLGRAGPGSMLERLAREVGEVFAVPCDVERALPLSDDALNPARRQYSSAWLLTHLRTRGAPSGTTVLAVVDVDLYVEGLTFVFGQAEMPGQWALISLCRLHGEGDEADDTRLSPGIEGGRPRDWPHYRSRALPRPGVCYALLQHTGGHRSKEPLPLLDLSAPDLAGNSPGTQKSGLELRPLLPLSRRPHGGERRRSPQQNLPARYCESGAGAAAGVGAGPGAGVGACCACSLATFSAFVAPSARARIMVMVRPSSKGNRSTAATPFKLLTMVSNT